MSYGLKYFTRYKTNDGIIKEIRFSKRDYTGDVTEWFVTKAGVEITQGSSNTFFEAPIVTSQKRLGLWLTEKYDLTEFVYDRKTFFCEILTVSTGHVEWSGWVEPWDAAHEYKQAPYAVNLTVSCGLAHLSKKKYANPSTSFKKTGLTIIRECLNIIESELPIRISTHLKENSFAGDSVNGLESFEIDVARYYDSNGEAIKCDEVLNDILNKFNAEITQYENRWVVSGIVDRATGFATSYIEYPFVGGGSSSGTSWTLEYVINDTEAFTEQGGEVRVLAPINKYRTEVDLGSQKPYFENGNMLVWSDAGLSGWDFTHMAKGNPGWEQYVLSGENALSVLKINGKSPQPYQKKRKKKFWQVVLPVITGAVGALLKNKYYDIEPTEWIESSAGPINKGDKTLTISFEYETASFSGDVLIAVRIPSTKTGKDWWLVPGMDNAGIIEEFNLIKVPAVYREDLIYIGYIDVSGNPNYPNGNTINWTYVVKGVPAGEIRRIGGAAGIIVENGDLVISKIANPGGSQASVGSSWTIINIRNNIKKGTFECTVALDKINIVSSAYANDPLPFQQVFVRFYKIATEDGKDGDWYKVFNLKGTLEGFVASDSAASYATTLERGGKTEEEATTINLVTGDYNPYFSGSLTKPGSSDNTNSWARRPGLSESLSIYRAMMLDRLCLTTRPLTVIEGDIYILPGNDVITYLHTIILADKENMRMKIVSYSYNDIQRRAKFTAVEVKYEEIPSGELSQDSYVPGQGTLNVIPGQGDGYYPTKQDSTSGRISTEDLPLTDEELTEQINANARLGPLFENIKPLTYVVKESSTQQVNLADYLSDLFLENNADQEEGDEFDPETLILSVVDKPVWVSLIEFDLLLVSATALAPVIGDFYITLKAYDEESDTSIEFRVPIWVIDKTVITVNLIDKTGGGSTVLGPLPGMFEIVDKVDFAIRVKGSHNEMRAHLTGGGPTGSATDETRIDGVNYPGTDETYFMFGSEGGRELLPGNYKLVIDTLYESIPRATQEFSFVLYDEEYLSLLTSFLTNGGLEVGEISPDGTTTFANLTGGNIKSVIADTEHDKVTQVLTFNGSLIKTTVHDLPISENEGEYYVYVTDEELDYGVYSIAATVSIGGVDVLVREYSFEIFAPEPKPEAGLLLGSFKPGTTNFEKIADLPLEGGEYDLPANFTVQFDGFGGIPYRSLEWSFYKMRNGFSNVNISQITGYPQNVTYTDEVTNEKVLIFGSKNSTQIYDVHEAPEIVRAVFIGRDENGQIVGIRQADFSFRVPLSPEEQSGLRLITIVPGSGDITVIDTNMPIAGRKVTLPLPNYYSVSARTFDGASFDQVKVQYEKKIAGAWTMLHLFGSDYVIVADPSGVVTDTGRDDLAYIIGTASGGVRYLLNPANVDVLIDEPGEYRATFTPILYGVPGTPKYTEFEIVESTTDLPPEDCCGSSRSFSALFGDGVSTSFIFNHGFESLDVVVEIYRVSPSRKVHMGIEIIDENSIRLTCAKPQAVNSLKVVIK